MNLSRFKKVNQTHTHTILKDDQGHEIRIAHSVLPIEMRKKLEGVPMYKDGGDVEDAAQPDKNVVVNVNPPEPAPLPGAPVQNEQPEAPKVAPSQEKMLGDQTANVSQAVQNLQQAEDQSAQLGAAKAKADADALQAVQLKNQAIQDKKSQDLKGIALKTQQVDDWLNKNPVRANAYLQDMPAPQKVLTAISLALGGAGAGASHQQNYAAQFLDSQIAQNIESQKANIENKKSAYGYYHQLYGDDVAATNLALVQANDWLKRQYDLNAMKLGTAAAQVNANKAKAELTLKNYQLLQETSGRLGTLQMGPQTLGQNEAEPQGQETAQAAPASNSAAAPTQIPATQLIGKVASVLGRDWDSKAADETAQMQKPKTYQLLTPDAQRKVAAMQYSTPADKNDYEKATSQLKAAQQAEKVLNGPNNDGVGGIHDLLQKMYVNSGSGSYLGGAGLHVRENMRDAAESIPYVGKGIKGAMDLLPKDQATKQYETGKAALLTDLATGLKGLLAPTDIESVVRPNLPAIGDSPKDIADKEQAMVNSIMKAVETNMLEKRGALAKKKHK